jgi:hypothetical protein
MTTSGWDLRDASSGTESNKSAQPAFQDALTFATGLWSSAFSTTRYADFDANAPLPTGQAVTGATFNFRYAAAAAGETACYWLEVRRASTGAVIGTHGSSGSPVDCTTGTTLKSVSTPISELNTTDLADDARVRVYGRESASKAMTIDVGTITGSTPSTSFTLYADTYTDAATGTPTTFPWALSGSDGSVYTTTNNWTASFSSTRYLKVTFPSYVPAGATVTGATFTTSYRPTASGRNACYYLEVYSGATLIGTHGSSAAPISCESTSTYQTDTVPLAEINTPARANGAIVKMYYWISGSGTRTTQHDLAQVSVTYQ